MSIYGKKCLERWKPQLIVPVPLHPAKKRMRGFNQSAYLAEKLSIITGIPWDEQSGNLKSATQNHRRNWTQPEAE